MKDISYTVPYSEAKLTNKFWYRIVTIFHKKSPRVETELKKLLINGDWLNWSISLFNLWKDAPSFPNTIKNVLTPNESHRSWKGQNLW